MMKLYSSDMTKQFEGCNLKSYQDIRGIWTIGYGHTKNVIEGMIITQQQADELLTEDLYWAERIVNQYVHVEITQNEFDALVDFVFNVGSKNFLYSTMLSKLNDNNIQGAALEFEKWDYSAGKVVAGLLRRRIAEKTEFLKG